MHISRIFLNKYIYTYALPNYIFINMLKNRIAAYLFMHFTSVSAVSSYSLAISVFSFIHSRPPVNVYYDKPTQLSLNPPKSICSFDSASFYSSSLNLSLSLFAYNQVTFISSLWIKCFSSDVCVTSFCTCILSILWSQGLFRLHCIVLDSLQSWVF